MYLPRIRREKWNCVCEIKTGKEGVKFENDAPACKYKKRSMARDDIEPT